MSLCLSELQVGQSGTVEHIDTTGTVRRRMLDLGIIEGTRIRCVHKSPAGNPVAYNIRGAIIALRTDDSNKIKINNVNE